MNKTIQNCLHMKTHTNIVEEDFENGTKKITTEKTKNQKKTYMDLLF